MSGCRLGESYRVNGCRLLVITPSRVVFALMHGWPTVCRGCHWLSVHTQVWHRHTLCSLRGQLFILHHFFHLQVVLPTGAHLTVELSYESYINVVFMASAADYGKTEGKRHTQTQAACLPPCQKYSLGGSCALSLHRLCFN